MMLSHDYVCGLVEGEGSFTYTTTLLRGSNPEKEITHVPAFEIRMHDRDYNLICVVRDTIGLRNKVYKYRGYRKDGYNRGGQAMLIVRDYNQLKNKIVPFFYKSLMGNKGTQFISWIQKMNGSDILKQYRVIKQLFNQGYFENLSQSVKR